MNELRKFKLEPLYQSFKNNENTYLHTAYVEADNKVHYYTDEDVRDYSKEYFTIESLEDGNNVYWRTTVNNSGLFKTIEISLDLGKTWNSYRSSFSDNLVATLNKGDKLWARGTNSAYGISTGCSHFELSKEYIVYGNIMSIIDKDNYQNNKTLTTSYPLNRQFQNSQIISAENLILPATTLTMGAYEYMFYNCKKLKIGPKELVNSSGGNNVYNRMFYECTSLKTSPDIKRNKFESRDCTLMFYNSGIEELKIQSDITIGYQSFYQICYICNKLKKIPDTLSILVNSSDGSFQQAFYNCINLRGPLTLTISGENLRSNTFESAFYGCSSLNNVTLDSDIWYPTMFNICSNLTNFTAATSPTIVYDRVFNGTTLQLTNSDIANVEQHLGRYQMQSESQIEPLYNENIILSWGYFGNDIFTPFSKSTEAFDYDNDTKILTIKAKIIAPPRTSGNVGYYYYCKKVQGENVELIKECGFKDFYDLEEIDLPNAWITSLGWYILGRDNKLKKMRIAGIEGTGGEYLVQNSTSSLEIVEFTKACDVTGQGNAAGASHATWPNRAMKIVLPDDLCSIRSTAAFSTDTIFYVSSQAKIQEYLAYSNWATIGAERFKLKSELEE